MQENEMKYAFSDFISLRKHKEAWFFFCDHFLSCVMGKAAYNRLIVTKPVSKWVTETDIAFVLLCMENNWEKWTYIACNKNKIKNKENELEVEDEHVPLTKYTSDKVNGQNNGWDDKGINRMYDLADLEEEQRNDKTYLEVEKDYLSYRKAEKQNKKRKRNGTECKSLATLDRAMKYSNKITEKANKKVDEIKYDLPLGPVTKSEQV